MNQNPGQGWLSSLVKSVPLSRVLVVPFALQIALAVGLTAYLSIRNGQKAVNAVASELRREVVHRVEQNLEAYLSDLQLLLHSNQTVAELQLLNLENLSAWEAYLKRQLDVFPPMIVDAVNNAQDEYLSMERLGDGQYLLRKAGKSTGYNLYTYEIDRNGKRTQLPQVIERYDVRSRPFYQTALQAKKFSFTQIFPSDSESALNVSASQPIYDSKGNLLGVTSTTTRLSQIGEFLRTMQVGQSGQIFILEGSGLLVATSTTEEPYRVENNQPIRLSATQSGNSLTQATAQHLMAKFGNLSRINNLQQLDFQFGGKRQFLEVKPLQGHPNVDWLMVVIVPETDFMEQIDRNTRTTIVLCIGAFILAMVLGILTARWIAKPIHRLSMAAKAIALKTTSTDFANEESNSVVVVQGINELEVLAESFNQMAQQLRESFGALATANEGLELRVEQRTQELQQEIQERVESERRVRQHNQALAELANHKAIADGDVEAAFNVITEKAANALEVE